MVQLEALWTGAIGLEVQEYMEGDWWEILPGQIHCVP